MFPMRSYQEFGNEAIQCTMMDTIPDIHPSRTNGDQNKRQRDLRPQDTHRQYIIAMVTWRCNAVSLMSTSWNSERFYAVNLNKRPSGDVPISSVLRYSDSR